MYKKKGHRAPGSGSISENPSGTKRAAITIRSKNGDKSIRKTKSFPTKKEAEEWLRKMRGEMDKGLNKENFQITIEEFFERWIKVQEGKLAPGTIADYTWLFQSYIIPKYGTSLIRDLNSFGVSEWYAELQRNGKSSNTVNYIHRALRSMLTSAFRDGSVAFNVCRLIVPPKPSKHKNVNALTEKEIEEFLSLARNSPLNFLLIFALMTGMRLGEILALTWRDIDFDKNTILVNKQIPTRSINGVPREAKPPKTDKGIRNLSVPQELIDELRSHRQEQQKHVSMMGDGWHEKNLVFPSSTGNYLDPKRPQEACKQIFASIGLNNQFTFHNLRHTNASMMIANKVSVAEVSYRLGHASIETTVKVYTHWLGNSAESVSTFEKLLNKAF